MIRSRYIWVVMLWSLCLAGAGAVPIHGPWKGCALMGNGQLCAVYTDDPRMAPFAHGRGVIHLYFHDFTADYVRSTAFVAVQGGHDISFAGPPRIDRPDSWSTRTRTPLVGGGVLEVRCIVHPKGAVLLEGSAISRPGVRVVARIGLRAKIVTDRSVVLKRFAVHDERWMTATWDNGISLVAAAFSPARARLAAKATGEFAASSGHLTLALVPAADARRAHEVLAALQAVRDPFAQAADAWSGWIRSGRTPNIPLAVKDRSVYLEAFARNLYAARASCLGGQVPADVTGQFLTNGMPQLYPRDSLMCARVFLQSGHPELTRAIIRFWSNPAIPRKTPGELYARYDARGKASDGGSGARYDEPEWDANAYLLHLLNVWHARTGVWLARKDVIFAAADFLADHVDVHGLLFEGGVVEWVGYLPATNMISWVGLRDAAHMARELSDPSRAARYLQAADRIRSSLSLLYDRSRQAYTAARFQMYKTDGNTYHPDLNAPLYHMWDTTVYFGPLWGFPVTDEIRASDRFYEKSTIALGGALEYIEAHGLRWLEEYGQDAFFFPSAAAAEYHFAHGDHALALRHIDWMLNNSNVYGLMPERIHRDRSDCSEASPLSWCCAEFAAAVLSWTPR